MGKSKVKCVGKLNPFVYKIIPNISKYKYIYKSDGLEKHVSKRHPECIEYLRKVTQILSEPDYVGVNPNEKGISFELVKIFEDNVQVGIKLDVKDNYLYIATLHTITESKLKHRIKSGRLKGISR